MRLLRFGEFGKERPGLFWNENTSLDVSAFGEDYEASFFETDGIFRLKKWLDVHQDDCPRLPVGIRLGPPLCRPSKIVCIGKNYVDHAKETQSEIPKEPVIFLKATSAICGAEDNLVLPPNAYKTDWEVELAVVIGKPARYVSVQESMDKVFGYLLHNDISERAFQKERSGQWVKGKSCDGFAPLGPYLVSKEEISNPHSLRLWLNLNGTRMQEDSTERMIFDIPYLIHYISQFMTLLPGDIISTGTPSGVGLGQQPPRFLKDKDILQYGVQGLGIATKKVVSC